MLTYDAIKANAELLRCMSGIGISYDQYTDSLKKLVHSQIRCVLEKVTKRKELK